MDNKQGMRYPLSASPPPIPLSVSSINQSSVSSVHLRLFLEIPHSVPLPRYTPHTYIKRGEEMKNRAHYTINAVPMQPTAGKGRRRKKDQNRDFVRGRDGDNKIFFSKCPMKRRETKRRTERKQQGTPSEKQGLRGGWNSVFQ